MAKRFQPMKEFGRTTKKPKLDLSVNKKTRNEPDNVHINLPASSLWDDDEDDVILLATQNLESEMAASKNNPNITESDITFTDFDPKTQFASTQRPTTSGQVDLLSQLFEDDDDFLKVAAAAEKDVECRQHVSSSEQLFETSTAESVVFKKPLLPKEKVINSLSNQQSASQNSLQLDPSAAARRQLATERQVQFLMERLDIMKEENSKLNKDLDEVKHKMQTKTGEASMLRDELRRAKQQVDKLKMEKLVQTEAANTESKLKIEQLAKKVKTKETKLQLKNMECSVLKMRQADESRRLDMSMMDVDEKVVGRGETHGEVITKPKTAAQMYSIMRLRKMTIASMPKTIESTSALLMKDAFECAEERGVSKKFNTFFQQELENIQLILAQLQLQPQDFDSEKLIESVRKVFSEFWSYVHTLQYGFYEKVQPYHDYNVMMDKSNRTPGCLHFKAALYENERNLNLRRYITALSAVCQQSPSATRIILNAKHEDYALLQIVIDAIIKLGYSTEISAHFGIVEACAILMRSILLHLSVDLAEDKDFFDLIFDLLKYLVFTRPSPWVLRELSYSVLDYAHRSLPPLTRFCENSPRRNFETDRSKSIYRFTNDACFLQVYCGLMESTFPLYQPLSKIHFELQTELCLNHVRFVFNCLTEPPHFVQKLIVLNDEDENIAKNEQDGDSLLKNDDKKYCDDAPSTSKQAASRNSSENSNISNSRLNDTESSEKSSDTCDCFLQMCLSVVTMIWLTLRQWLRMEKDVQTTRVALISRISVHLLYIMFCDNYHASLFREDEDTTRHYYFLICTWWQENAEELQFTDIQLKLLQKLRHSYAMPKLLKEEEVNLDNIKSDLEQWRKVTHDKNCQFTLKNGESVIKNLRLLDDIFDPDIFLASLNKDYLQLKTFDDG